MLILHIYIKKKKKNMIEDDGLGPMRKTLEMHDFEEDALKHPHEKQIFDILAWHNSIVDTRWYVKPRSTCWFEEYLFKIYTPDMFYDIL